MLDKKGKTNLNHYVPEHSWWLRILLVTVFLPEAYAFEIIRNI